MVRESRAVSYDLAVWEGQLPDTNEAAAATFRDLCDRYLAAEDPPGPTPRIRRYVEALLARWPDIGDDAGASSPWASSPLIDEAIGPIVYFPMVYSQADEAVAFAAALAWAHDLVCFDPQDGGLRPPPFDPAEIDRHARDGTTVQAIAEIRQQMGCDLPAATAIYEQRASVLADADRPPVPDKPALVLTTPRGRRIDNPSVDVLRRVLPELGSDSWYAILEREDGWFVQVGCGTAAGTRPGWYALERQEGGPSEHYRTEITDLREVIDAFVGFATDDPDWTRRFTWQRYRI
jgi:hypothetical protein